MEYVDPTIREAVVKLASKKFKYLSLDAEYSIDHVDDLKKLEAVVPLFANYRVFYKQPLDLER